MTKRFFFSDNDGNTIFQDMPLKATRIYGMYWDIQAIPEFLPQILELKRQGFHYTHAIFV